MIRKKAYIDIETIYSGKFNIDSNDQYEKNKAFKDYENWKFLTKDNYKGVDVEYQGIIGILVIEVDINKYTNIHKVISYKLTQLIGKECTKENLMKELDGVNEILSYHGRTKPDKRGYTGYDFGVINAQFGIILDELPNVTSTDLELICHKKCLYGGLKFVEKNISCIRRGSGVSDGNEAVKILKNIGKCDNIEKIDNMWKKVKSYNMEDIIMLVALEQYLMLIKYCK